MDMRQTQAFVRGLYKVQAELFVLLQSCRVAHDESCGAGIQAALDSVNGLLSELKPDSSVFNDPRSDAYQRRDLGRARDYMRSLNPFSA